MSHIYTPKGKAREYSPLALNVYTGCDHNCEYCYLKGIIGNSRNPRPKKNLIDGLSKELDTTTINDQVLLSFLCDPYCHLDSELKLTRETLEILNKHNVPTAILTKGGNRIMRDQDLIKKFGNIKVGATLTFNNDTDSKKWEENAALPSERLEMLKYFHSIGIKTFASFEPVIEPEQSLNLIKSTLGYIDQYKVGKWNHDKRAHAIDWAKFGNEAVEILSSNNKDFYIKNDLACFIEGLTEQETNHDALALKSYNKEPRKAQMALF